METPSSTRRLTRSQALAALNSNSINPSSSSELTVVKSRPKNVLVDITNDSPIVGVAMETPSSLIKKLRSSIEKRTPGSGEDLLRGQVKTLLQKVEEESDVSRIGFERGPFLRFVNSPMRLLAPTPMNTPLVSSDERETWMFSPVVEEQLISQMVSDIMDGKHEQNLESSLITRSLFSDFPKKSDNSSLDLSECSSVLTYQGGSAESEYKEKSSPDDDDSSSMWSVQALASTNDEDDEEDYDVDYGAEEEDEGALDELCNGISNISMKEKKVPKFQGKHTRFIYNSDDEIIEEEV